MSELEIHNQTEETWPFVWTTTVGEYILEEPIDPTDDLAERFQGTRTLEPLVNDKTALFCKECGEYCIEDSDEITLVIEFQESSPFTYGVQCAYNRGLYCASHDPPLAVATLRRPRPVWQFTEECEGDVHTYSGQIEIVEGYNPAIIGEPNRIAVYREMTHSAQYPVSKMAPPSDAVVREVGSYVYGKGAVQSEISVSEVSEEVSHSWAVVKRAMYVLAEDQSSSVWWCGKNRVTVSGGD